MGRAFSSRRRRETDLVQDSPATWSANPNPAAGHVVAKRRKAHCRGSEVLEFTLALLPLFSLTFLLLDVSWIIFIKSTVQQAARMGCRYGVTNQPVPTGSDLTTEIKKTVQNSALGFLNGSTGLSMIHVHYWQPPDPGCTASCTATDVSTSTTTVKNAGGNVMIVSVDNFSVTALLPRFFSWKTAPDQSPTIFSVASGDRIEPYTGTPPPAGTAP